MNLLCKVIGHSLSESTPVYGNHGIVYNCYICKRCGKRIPVSEDDAKKKATNTAYVSSIMNADRMRYGLKPLDWDD